MSRRHFPNFDEPYFERVCAVVEIFMLKLEHIVLVQGHEIDSLEISKSVAHQPIKLRVSVLKLGHII